ncbi:MAG: hypothetical protein ACOYT8_03670 [Candidatus Dependentiae bacterium]
MRLFLLLFFLPSYTMDVKLQNKTVQISTKTAQLLKKHSVVVQATHAFNQATIRLPQITSQEFNLLKEYVAYLEKIETGELTTHDKNNLLHTLSQGDQSAQLALSADFFGINRPPYETSYFIERQLKNKKNWNKWKRTKQLTLAHLLPASATAALCHELHKEIAITTAQSNSIITKELSIPALYNNNFKHVVWSTKGTYLALAQNDTILIHDFKKLPRVHHLLGYISVMKFIDDKTLAAGTSRGHVWLLDVNTIDRVKPTCTQPSEITIIASTLDNNLLVGSRDMLSKINKNGAVLWEQKFTRRDEEFKFTTISCSTMPHQFITGEANGRVLLWDSYNGFLIKELCVLSEPVVCVGFDQFNIPYAVGCKENRIVTWNGNTKKSKIGLLKVNNAESHYLRSMQKLWTKTQNRNELALINNSNGQIAVILRPDKYEYCNALRLADKMKIYDYHPDSKKFFIEYSNDENKKYYIVDFKQYDEEVAYLEVLSAAQLFFIYNLMKEQAPLVIDQKERIELFYSLPSYYQDRLKEFNKVTIPFTVRITQKIPPKLVQSYKKIKAFLNQTFFS